MAEPDELYTLRAQFWLGHYQLALDEAKSIQRRPMSPDLKEEREEFVMRCYLAMGDYGKVIAGTDTAGLRALSLQAQFEAAGTDEGKKQAVIQQVQALLAESASPSVQLAASHIFLKAGLKKESLQCVHMGATLEHVSMTLQLYLSIDRLDLAQSQLQAMKRKDEDSILTQLGGVYLAMATGSSLSKDAMHTLSQLSEQYGPSILLLNLMACALLQQGEYAAAEQKLEQARQEFGASNDADTIANLIVAYQYQSKPTNELVQTLVQFHPTHYLAQGLTMVMGAFERESMKYRVAA
mmetsp:Transcript_128804/g.192012  ORF Transcript_128804/g.192012 Transcript_128804/m.192012 type:complete len:295 (-) Transcript_128804:150-1034(-)